MLEETGLHIHNVQFGHVTNDIMIDENKHYVTIFMMSECKCPMKQPLNLEPHKCEGWNSYSWEELCQFVANSNGTNNNDNFQKEKAPILFGPLLKLVQEAPQSVLDFISGN